MTAISAVGCSRWDLDTPALLVDLGTMERNIARITGVLGKHQVGWRPHTKALKVPALAHKLIDAGALGVTCAKVSEAEVMADAGIADILIANQVVGKQKIARLVNLRRRVDVVVSVDDPGNVSELSAAAVENGVSLRAAIEVDVGMGRCGLDPGQLVVDLAERVHGSPGLTFAGLMAWEGPCAGVKEPEQKRACVQQAIGKLIDTAELCRQQGLPVDIVSCGGTGTYWETAKIPGVTEVQAGGGVFGDIHYVEDYGADHEMALTVFATVISRPTPARVVVDTGFKTMSRDFAMPRPLGVAARNVALSAEHGRFELETPSDLPRVGEKIEFVVGYSDSTVFLHDELIGVRNDRVEAVWPILGRGKLQ